MKQDNDNQPRIESMLRQWGSQEAIRQQELPPPPQAQRPARHRLLRVMGPLAAAAALLIGGILLGNLRPWPAGPQRDDAALRTQVKTLGDQLAQVRGELEASQQDLAAASKRAKVQEQLQGEFDRLAADLTAARAEVAALQKKADESALAAQTATDEAKDLRMAMATSAAETQAAQQKVLDMTQTMTQQGRRLAAAAEELSRVRGGTEQADATLRKAQDDLTSLRSQQDLMFGDLQRVFLSAGALSQDGPAGATGADQGDSLRVRQLAARSARLIERCADVRAGVRSANVKLLLDRLEVVLTRLDMIHADSAIDARAWSALLDDGQLVQEVDKALAAPAESPAVRVWLMQAKMVLAGVQYVI